MSFPDTAIRPATPGDIPHILAMVRELAEYEKLSHEVVATEEDYYESLFGERPAAEALFCEQDGDPAGYAIFFQTFSTFVGKPGIWLEDLYVRPEFRRNGIGTALLQAIGKVALDRFAGRYEWSVLDWNRDAIALYEKMGGRILTDWRIVRLNREGIESLSSLKVER